MVTVIIVRIRPSSERHTPTYETTSSVTLAYCGGGETPSALADMSYKCKQSSTVSIP